MHDIGKRTVYHPEMGEVIRLWSGGGGGYGDPLRRDPALVARDVADELVSVDRAGDVYGVVLCDGAVDAAATLHRREGLTAKRVALGAYDFGPARSEWERVHGVAAELIADWLPSLPAGVRRYAQRRVYRELHEAGPGPYDATAVRAVLQTVGYRVGVRRSRALAFALGRSDGELGAARSAAARQISCLIGRGDCSAYILRQPFDETFLSPEDACPEEMVHQMIVQGWERSAETSVIHLSCAGLTAIPLFVWGCRGLRSGVGRCLDRPPSNRRGFPYRRFAAAVARCFMSPRG